VHSSINSIRKVDKRGLVQRLSRVDDLQRRLYSFRALRVVNGGPARAQALSPPLRLRTSWPARLSVRAARALRWPLRQTVTIAASLLRVPGGRAAGCRRRGLVVQFATSRGCGRQRVPVRTGIVIHRIRDGKIVEYWSVTDIARVLQQIGALPGQPG
jgi:hypothetical protein